MTKAEIAAVRRDLAAVTHRLNTPCPPDEQARAVAGILGRLIPDPDVKYRLKQQPPNPLK